MTRSGRFFWLLIVTMMASGCSVFQPSVEQRLQRMQQTSETSDFADSDGALQNQLNELKQLRQQYPDNPGLWLQSGRLALKSGDCYAATVAFKQALGLEADDADIFLGLGVCADYNNNHPQAQQYYRRGISRYPRHWQLQNNLAYSRLLQGKSQQALNDLLYLAQQYPYPAVRHNLAIAYAMQGQFDQAYQIEAELYGEQQAMNNQLAYRHFHQRETAP
ncbi:tetratricopeptide repeat protein [Bacterioplanoides sp.]|uniref:tetratricopeptide repeat protein n=1 Tax=Bacterioplanoides sp. TaxID=2066072 RepID=UPI003B001AE2